jgi:predicted transglutaminase-like cysteine proteinase
MTSRPFPAVLAFALIALLPATAWGIDAGRHIPTKRVSEAPKGARMLCHTYDWACAAGNGAAFGDEQRALLETVNLAGNRLIRPITDKDQFGRSDVWTLPYTGQGDCEDFALWKKQELIRQGISPDRLLLATVLDLDRATHAVLVVRTDAEDLVLDNVTDQIVTWRDTGYVFLRLQNPADPKAWVNSFSGGFLG